MPHALLDGLLASSLAAAPSKNILFRLLDIPSVQNSIVVGLLGLVVFLLWRASQREYWRVAFRELRAKPIAMISLFVLLLYCGIALLDSILWRDPLPLTVAGLSDKELGERAKEHGLTLAALKQIDAGKDAKQRLRELGIYERDPKTKETLYDDQAASAFDRIYDRIFPGVRKNPEKTFSAPGAAETFVKIKNKETGKREYQPLAYPGEHPLGTSKAGRDVFYMAFKSIRTGLIIGGATTLLVIPLALIFGTVAGFYGGRIDDLVQYIYTVLGSVPGILLIVAFMLALGQGLPQLCIALGIVSWTGLCRLLRAETLKLRDQDYVQAAIAFGVSKPKVIIKHIVPNVMHIVLIATLLRFSGLVLAEAVLTYLNIGVGADAYSWGMMINAGRLELAREPVVWWNLFAAFVFMFGLVLTANLFGDAVRDALDPRLRTR